MQKYSVNQKSIDTLLHYIKDKEIVIPEIQRPFVWKTSKVRDLMDSLYKGFPVGYIITWKNPNIRLKNGSLSSGKQILIDGQQRITALMSAILGQEVVDENYKKGRIFIAFNPLEEKFETQTPAIKKSPIWIHDIAWFFSMNSTRKFWREYLSGITQELTPEEEQKIEDSIDKLSAIKTRDVGIVELDAKLDISDVTEIFVRINSKGVRLDQADFAMSKIASYEPNFDNLFGVNLRKCIDYFAHLAKAPHFFEEIDTNDKEFKQTNYLQKIKWLKNENDDLYDPSYKDILRVSFVKEFNRGRLSDLVKLLSGQNPETRKFDENTEEESFKKLQTGVIDFVNENHFKKFLIIIRSAGIIHNKLINSKNVLNFAYIVYLKLRKDNIANNEIERYTRKWLIISILTERYSGSPESRMDRDIRDINKNGIENTIKDIETIDLSETYWKNGLVADLKKSSVNNPFLNLFFIAQIYFNYKALFSKSVSVENLVEIRGDIHHIFPKKYLQNHGKDRAEYNQLANFVYLQQDVNIKVGAKAPSEYFSEVLSSCGGDVAEHGTITNKDNLMENLKHNAIPSEIFNMEIEDYDTFLDERRVLIAQLIEQYYKSL